jgi:PAS domain S-box-containing protein
LSSEIKKQYFTEFSDSDKRYRDLYEESPQLFRTIDRDGKIIDCNKAYANTLGYSKEEVLGASIFDHTADNDLPAIRESFRTWRKNGLVKGREIWMKRKDGTIFPALLNATSIFGTNGLLIGSNTVITDLTEIHEARKKIQEHEVLIENQLEELQKMARSKNEFIAMITHELKTPLVPIKGYLDMILKESFGPLTDLQKDRIKIVKSSADSLLSLVADLLDAQKLELGQLKLVKEENDIGKITLDIVETIKADAEKKGIQVQSSLQGSIICPCDKNRVSQVITNILSNSLDFCPKDMGIIKIRLSIEDGFAKIMIKDNGIGMTKENLGHLFKRFYQLDTKTTREHGGTGLGLSICRGIIETHGGKIWAESEGLGKGLEIYFTLPLAEVTNPTYKM